jgi:hypothetical protein
MRIATRAGMGCISLIVIWNLSGFSLVQGNPDKAREHWRTSTAMIERMGYHRRGNEVTELGEQLA